MSDIKELDEGSVIGNYRVVRVLGQGGMGTVYEVEHLELGTHYALKTFTFDPEDEAAHALKTKFLEEGKLLARLKHSNLTHVFDLGFEEGSQMPYFVMDLITYEDGETYTAEDIDLKDIDEEMVYNWFGQLASALDYIHGEGIVHRDIKPSNLLVDKDLNVVLTDFGISRIFGSKIKSEVEATRTMVTKTGRGKLVLGTEHYIAPEVAEGEEATPQADAYSLGVMLLRWLTGFYYGDNPGAIALLSKKKYRWLPVIARLVAPAGRRPEKYTELVTQLKPNEGAVSERAKPPQAARKKRKLKENILATFCALFIVGVVGTGGYFGWQYIERKGAERDRQYAELKQRMEADKAAAEKKEAEEKAAAERKAAEEKRIAEEKEAARKAKIAERERAEAARTKIEKQDHSMLAVRQMPKIAETKPEPEKPKEEFVVVKDDAPEEDVKDYGPIPDKKYTWLKNNNVLFPQEVEFQLANGAMIALLPIKAGTQFQGTEWRQECPSYRKVVITRPFWVTKYLVTAAQFREYDETAVADCLPIEKAAGEKYPVSRKLTRAQIEAFCKMLSRKYRAQLPRGYVFRLPTQGEWCHALSIDAHGRKCGNWWDDVLCNGGGSKNTMEKLRREKRLDALCQWQTDRDYGWDITSRFFVGGRNRPMVTGVCDPCVHGPHQIVLDNKDLFKPYEETTDPLFLAPNAKSTMSVLWQGDCSEWKGSDFQTVCHIVVGPDLIKEQAWENERIEFGKAKVDNLPKQGFRLDPKSVPAKLSHPKEVRLKMVNKREMVFCCIPKVKQFWMTNPDGQDKQNHKVELTYPFWISKYCVTADQLREFGKYECENSVSRDVEIRLPKYLICPSRCRTKWMAFCKFLNERYGEVLPAGYVFRLPTEAEYEWATVADKNGNMRDMNGYFSPGDEKYIKELERAWKVAKMPSEIRFDNHGGKSGFYIGGRVRANAFGVCDMIVSGWGNELIMLDTYDGSWWVTDKATGSIEWNVNKPVEYMVYAEKEVDPLHCAGYIATRVTRRNGLARGIVNNEWTGCAHIVIGPELEKKAYEEELAPYPRERFGGVLLDKVAKVSKMSSKSLDGGREFNTAENHRLLLSDESVAKRLFIDNEWWVGCQTEPEESPWIEIELDKVRQISGVQIDVLKGRDMVVHPRIWVSDDRKRWNEVFKDDRELGRYVADFSRRMIKGKWIRIGREPRYKKERFVLSKVLIYGKEK